MDSQILFLIQRYYQIQKHRVSTGNQIFALKEAGEDTVVLEEYNKKFHDLEKDIAKFIEKDVQSHEMWKWLKEIKGIGPLLGAALLSLIDIEKAQHASSVWKYAGLAPGQRRKRGQKVDYNPFLKTICWKISEQFVKSKGQYREVYDTQKAYYQQKFPEEVKDGKRTMYTKGHIHAMAKRKAVKRFLSHFWAEWREMEGLSVSEPFAHEKLGMK